MEIIENTTVYFKDKPISIPLNNMYRPIIYPKYLCIHSTANLGAPAINHVNLWNNDPFYAVHYVGDWTGKCYHCIPNNLKCNQVGNGNPYVIGIELCETDDYEEFKKVWNLGIEWCVTLLKELNWGVDRVISHNDARIWWGGTDHTDPIPYFRKFNKTFDDFKEEVEFYMSINYRDLAREIVNELMDREVEAPNGFKADIKFRIANLGDKTQSMTDDIKEIKTILSGREK